MYSVLKKFQTGRGLTTNEIRLCHSHISAVLLQSASDIVLGAANVHIDLPILSRVLVEIDNFIVFDQIKFGFVRLLLLQYFSEAHFTLRFGRLALI